MRLLCLGKAVQGSFGLKVSGKVRGRGAFGRAGSQAVQLIAKPALTL